MGHTGISNRSFSDIIACIASTAKRQTKTGYLSTKIYIEALFKSHKRLSYISNFDAEDEY